MDSCRNRTRAHRDTRVLPCPCGRLEPPRGLSHPNAPPDARRNHDNDGDGLTDYPDDPGCSTPNDGNEADPACSDGFDNDSDGLTDYPNDPGCSTPGDTSETDAACADGFDNDGDGLTDYPNDPGCNSTRWTEVFADFAAFKERPTNRFPF